MSIGWFSVGWRYTERNKYVRFHEKTHRKFKFVKCFASADVALLWDGRKERERK